jgi:transmembrane sensor
MADHTEGPESPTEPVDWDALARYLTGESPAAEAEAMRRWLAARPERAELAAALERSISRLAYQAPTDLDVETGLRSVRARRDQPDVRLRDRASRAAPTAFGSRRAFAWPSGRRLVLGLRAAAVVGAIAIGSALLWQRRSGGDERAAAAATAQMYATAVGQRDSLRLSDGTRVVLGPGSRLAVDQGYGRTHREVELRGEAYFDARHDSVHPFTVRVGNATVRDVGTAFAVHSDPGDGVRVVVTSGAVVLKAETAPADSGVLLRQGDRGVLRPGEPVVTERGAAIEEDLAWMRGRLVFRDAPLAQVRADLRRWYGIELRIADPALADRHVTTAFDGERPQRVLEVLALILGAEVEQQGDTAILRNRASGVRRR